MNASASFFPDAPAHMPLAKRLRPHSASDVIGQQYLLGPGKPLRVAFTSGEPYSMTLWGLPGAGKTMLTRLMTNAFDVGFIALSVVLSGVKNTRKAVERAEQFHIHGHRTPMFIDEVHRSNKSQQDAFLPHVGSRLFTLIGATTGSPSSEVNGASPSRAVVHVLKSPSDDKLKQFAERVRQELGGLKWTSATLDAIVVLAGGDDHKLLNNIKIVTRAAHAQADGDAVPAVDEALLASVLSEDLHRLDKGGGAFYDQIGALHKSVCSPDPDGVLYWFCHILGGGVNLRHLAHRIARMAWGGIGLADSHAGRTTPNAAGMYEHLGSLEGELALTQAVAYLAIVSRSNTGYNAYNTAQTFVSQDESHNVPAYPRNAPTKLMKELGYGHVYRYAYDEPEAYAAGETYFPDDLPAQNWYAPTSRGLRGRIGEKLRHLCGLDAQ